MNFTSFSFRGLLLLLLCWTTTTFLDAQTIFRAELTGRQEALPVPTLANGSVTATVNDGKLTVVGAFEGLSAPTDTALLGGAHIHLGYAGQNGTVLFPLVATFSDDLQSGSFEEVNNTFDITEEQIAQLSNRQMYVNIHSLAFSSGEIRGQLLPTEAMFYGANLFGSNEVPLVMTSGSGAVAIDVVGMELTLTGSFQGLEGDLATDIGGGAHIHIAMAGMTGEVLAPLTVTPGDNMRSGIFEAANNSITLTEDQLAALEGRRLYVNIHSTRNPSGELRGQIVGGASRTVFRAHLSGSNEVPVVTTTATGMLLSEVVDNTTILVSGSFNNLESDLAIDIAGGAHIHNALAGSIGSIATVLNVNTDDNRTGTFPASNNSFMLTPEQMTDLYRRAMYTNIHSLNHTSGELRGQLLPESQINFSGFLSSIFEVPEVVSQAFGGMKAELQGSQLVVTGSFSGSNAIDLSIGGGAHLHLAPAGATGEVNFLLTPNLSENMTSGTFEASDNTFELSSEQIMALRGRQFYANIHTLNNPTGELRAQLLHEATTYFIAPLSGASEVPAVNTGASGMIALEYDAGKAYISGSFSGLESDFASDVAGGAHIHNGLAGSTGGIVALLNTTLEEDNRSGIYSVPNNVIDISDGLLDTMRMRAHYVNIHSTDVPSGELRGQFLPLATAYFTTTLQAINEVQPETSPALGAAVFELNGNHLTMSGSFSDLTGEFAGDIAGGSHIHNAAAGSNGDIVFTLGPALNADLLGGIFTAVNNVNELDDAQLSELFAGNFYVNIHTAAINSGELRGQVLAEINRFPSNEAAITAPTDGAEITIEGATGTPFEVTWNAASDRDQLAYIWQLATDEDFNSIAFQTNVGMQTMFATDYATMDMLLEAAGLAVGDTIRLYHRAIASDGSLNSPGATASVMLIRGIVEDAPNTADLELSITAPATYDIYVDVPYIITLTNNGPLTATNIMVFAGLPDGMVHTSNTVTAGQYNLFFQTWSLDSLQAGQTATLTLTLFPLVGDVPITNFVQVMASDQEDPDSTPGNDMDQTPDEDDEAAITIMPTNVPPMGGIDSDLELTIEAEGATYDIYVDVTYTLTLTNNGPDAAANISVSAGLPDGMVHTSNTASVGAYNLFFERWDVPFLESGAAATLTLVLFPLIGDSDITNFVQVMASDQSDPDSTPGNDMDQTPDEDDEAAVTLTPMGSFSNNVNAKLSSIEGTATKGLPTSVALPLQSGDGTVSEVLTARLFPVPAVDHINLAIESQEEFVTEVQLFRTTGELLITKTTPLIKGHNQTSLDISFLPAGMYFVTIGKDNITGLKFNKF